MVAPAKPRLLYFNGPWDYLGARIVTSYIEPFQRLLEQDFEVIGVAGNCDFAAEVARHRPDLVLFGTGAESLREPDITIAHTDAFPEIPRLGWVFRDPCSPSRGAAMNRLRAWRVDQVFSDFRPTDCPIPFFADSIYVPWWVDDRVFRDYGETKDLPVTLTGAGWLREEFYTWRKPVFAELAPRLPVLHVPAFNTREQRDVYVGEAYARLLNRSLISAGCGSVSRFITLKLLEIPAARCCLLTEETQVLRAAGFADGVNCLFATPANVVEKVSAALRDPARLQAITDAGHELVQRRHTQRNRRHFAEWFALWKTKQPGQRIVQLDPFAPLQLVGAEEPRPANTFPAENPLTEALVAGHRLLDEGQPREALERFEWVLRIIDYVAEARLGAALCHLRLGDPATALQHSRQILFQQVKVFAMKRPDPVSVSVNAIALARAGDAKQAFALLATTAACRHPALNAARWVLAQRWQELRRRSPAFPAEKGDESQNLESIHLLAPRSFADWAAYWSGCLAR